MSKKGTFSTFVCLELDLCVLWEYSIVARQSLDIKVLDHKHKSSRQYSRCVTRTKAFVCALDPKPSVPVSPAGIVHRALIVCNYRPSNGENHCGVVVGRCRKAKEMG